MTNENIARQAGLVARSLSDNCPCGHERRECWTHTAEALHGYGQALVSQAYEEAAQMAESMPLRHARFDFECAQESARAIRALRDSLQPEGEVTGV